MEDAVWMTTVHRALAGNMGRVGVSWCPPPFGFESVPYIHVKPGPALSHVRPYGRQSPPNAAVSREPTLRFLGRGEEGARGEQCQLIDMRSVCVVLLIQGRWMRFALLQASISLIVKTKSIAIIAISLKGVLNFRRPA